MVSILASVLKSLHVASLATMSDPVSDAAVAEDTETASSLSSTAVPASTLAADALASAVSLPGDIKSPSMSDMEADENDETSVASPPLRAADTLRLDTVLDKPPEALRIRRVLPVLSSD